MIYEGIRGEKRPRRFRWSILPLLLAIPFSYYSIGEIRLLPIILLLSIVLVFRYGTHFRNAASIDLYGVLVFYCFVLSATTLAMDVFFSMLFFGWLTYWPVFAGKKKIYSIDVNRVFLLLIWIGIVLSIGLLAQVFAYRNLGIEAGKMDLIENREAFGFIWNDYSFLSLFLVSLIPLSWRSSARAPVKIAITALFLIASVMTSARAGVAALAITYGIFFLTRGVKIILTMKMRRVEVFYFFLAVVLIPVLAFYVTELFPRLSSSDDSGRLDGYLAALKFSARNILFGAKFDVLGYKEAVDTIPHNLFIYILTVGGALFLIGFLLWFLKLFFVIKRGLDSNVVLSVLISVVGFQFIPAFFSAYYFAFMLSLCIILHEQKKVDGQIFF